VSERVTKENKTEVSKRFKRIGKRCSLVVIENIICFSLQFSESLCEIMVEDTLSCSMRRNRAVLRYKTCSLANLVSAPQGCDLLCGQRFARHLFYQNLRMILDKTQEYKKQCSVAQENRK
jgi:hypothetical protein